MIKRHSAEQIVGWLRQAAVDLGKGMKFPEFCRKLLATQQTYYGWRTKYGAMEPKKGQAASGPPARERSAETFLADQALDTLILKEADRPYL